jgi:CelD/BcsL family acetyltransferase involved in cellulose biosynthesis
MYGLKVRQIESIGNIHSQRFDFIVARSARQAYRAIWQHLLHETDRWDVLQLCQLPAGSRTLEELPKLAAEEGFLTGLWHSCDSPYLSLSGRPWESYVKSLDAKHRANLRNRLKRLSGCGEVRVETIESAVHVASALTDGLRLEAAAWKGAAGTAICSRPELRRFYTKLAERAAKRGWLRLYFLTVDHHRIAFHFSVCWRDKLYLLKPGYDPVYASYSPSNLLCYLVLHDAFGRGLAEYDFLGTAEPWKLEWTRETKPHYWLFVFPRLLRPRLLHYVKFRLVPRLQRWRLYTRLRNILVGPRTRGDARKFARDTF